MPRVPQFERLQQNIDRLAELGGAAAELDGMSWDRTLASASEIGRAAIKIQNPNFATAQYVSFEPAELITEEFTAPIDAEVHLGGCIVVGRKVGGPVRTLSVGTVLINKKLGSHLPIMTMTVPRTEKDTQHFQNLAPSSRPNLELFMRSSKGAAYPLRGPDELKTYDAGVRYIAPFLEKVLQRVVQANT